jgi:iron complex transport system substrate-binding protein
VTTWDDYPAAVTTLPKVGDFTTPNLEAIASAKPDLVLVTGGVQTDVLGKLEGLGASVLVIDPQDLDGVYRSIGLVGDATGLRAKAAALVDSMRADIAGVRDRVGSANPVTCFVEIGWNPLFTTGEGTLIDDMVRIAGGANVVKQPGYVGYSTEQLLRDQPAAYLATRSSVGETSTVSQRPGYARLAAVREGRVYALDDNLVSRPGPRVGQGVAEIARALHPDRF